MVKGVRGFATEIALRTVLLKCQFLEFAPCWSVLRFRCGHRKPPSQGIKKDPTDEAGLKVTTL